MFKRMFVAMSAFTLVVLCSTSLSAQHAKPEESFNLQASVVVNAFQSVTEQHLKSILNGLKILASTDDVGSAEWPRIQSPLTQFSQLVPSAAAVFFDSALLFEFPSDMGSPTLAGAVQKMLAEPSGVVRYTFRGQDKVAVFSKSAATGWVFVLGKAGAAAAQQDAGRGATPSISRTLMPRA